MSGTKPESDPHDWEAAVTSAAEHVAGASGAGGAAPDPEGRIDGRAAYRLAWALPVLAAVLAWNVWWARTPPELPPDEEIARALRETAGALAEEALALRAQLGRLPTAAELDGELDEELTYALSGAGFVITHTAGVVRVRYDGTAPVGEWVARGGYTLVEVAR